MEYFKMNSNINRDSSATTRAKEGSFFGQFDRPHEESDEHSDLGNEEISTNRKASSSLPNEYNKYNKYNQNHQNQQNNRITRETTTDDLYRYTWEPKKKVWIVGDDSTADGNAVLLEGFTNCPVIIEIAREKTYTDGKSYPVEIIGQYAFYGCALYDKFPTKTIFVTKQVKIIKQFGFGNEWYLTNFTIESGSQLQSILYCGLHYIGFDERSNSLTKTLILPPTLSSVAADGIYKCNLFEEIVYCGSHDLSSNSSSTLYSSNVEATILRVTNNYNFSKLFGNSITASTGDKANEVSLICQNVLLHRSPSPIPSPSYSHSLSPSALLLLSLNSLCPPFIHSLSLLLFFVSALLVSSPSHPSPFLLHQKQPKFPLL